MTDPKSEIVGLAERVEREIDEATDARVKAIADYTDASCKLKAANCRLDAALRARATLKEHENG